MEKNDTDYLTQLHNEPYLEHNYKNYLKQYHQGSFIMLDITKFKSINDTYGHQVGDDYLVLLASVLKDSFADSDVFRLHGDEFVIITNLDNEAIRLRFDLCKKRIEQAVNEGKIIRSFSFNAGSAPLESRRLNTQEKADYMMYYAKKNENSFQPFDNRIWQTKLEEIEYNNKVNLALKEETFSYNLRQYFNKNHEPQPYYELATKDKYGKSILKKKYYDLLRTSLKMQKIDLYNMHHLLNNIMTNDDKKYVLCIDYKSLIWNNDMLDYIKLVCEIYTIPYPSLILSINLKNINPYEYDELARKINELTSLKFQVGINHYSNKIGPYFWQYNDLHSIKFDDEYWKEGIYIPKIDYVIKREIGDMDQNPYHQTIPIFTNINSQKEEEYLKTFIPNDTLLSGNHYAPAKRILTKEKENNEIRK